MILTRPWGKGHPSQNNWEEWSNLVNKNLRIFSPRDDYDSINDKLHALLIQSGIKYIGGKCVICTTSQIAEYFGITPDSN